MLATVHTVLQGPVVFYSNWCFPVNQLNWSASLGKDPEGGISQSVKNWLTVERDT